MALWSLRSLRLRLYFLDNDDQCSTRLLWESYFWILTSSNCYNIIVRPSTVILSSAALCLGCNKRFVYQCSGFDKWGKYQISYLITNYDHMWKYNTYPPSYTMILIISEAWSKWGHNFHDILKYFIDLFMIVNPSHTQCNVFISKKSCFTYK